MHMQRNNRAEEGCICTRNSKAEEGEFQLVEHCCSVTEHLGSGAGTRSAKPLQPSRCMGCGAIALLCAACIDKFPCACGDERWSTCGRVALMGCGLSCESCADWWMDTLHTLQCHVYNGRSLTCLEWDYSDVVCWGQHWATATSGCPTMHGTSCHNYGQEGDGGGILLRCSCE